LKVEIAMLFGTNLIVRNSLFNFIGQLVPIVAGLVCIPVILRLLGTERFGILALAWMVLNYFTLFDFGLGRATTKFIADFIERHDRSEISSIIWTSLGGQILLGLIAAFLLVAVSPLLVERVFIIPSGLRLEARQTFQVLACMLPVTLAGNGLRSALGGGQRFDLINAVNMPLSTLNFIIPLVVLGAGVSLPGVVSVMGTAWAAAGLTYFIICLKVFPEARRLSINRQALKLLFAFGGWITVSNLIGPVLVYLDRFLIATFLSVAAVAYYTAPYEAVIKLWIFPTSLVASLFPAFSALNAGSPHGSMNNIYNRSMKSLLFFMGPLVFVAVFFGSDILLLWLGADFAAKSIRVFQILAVGVLINSLAQVPFTLIQGSGRPDVTAKFHLIELPLYFWILWFLLEYAGIEGAAMAWSLRVALDATFLLVAARRLFGCRMEKQKFYKAIGILTLLIGLAFLSGCLYQPIWHLAGGVAGLAVLYAAVWRLVLDEAERVWLKEKVLNVFRMRRMYRNK